MSAADNLLEFLQSKLHTEIHVGPWLAIEQERIDRFAAVTGDVQWIHTDPERAARESPYGTTVAHGFLTLQDDSEVLYHMGGLHAPEAARGRRAYGIRRSSWR